jgi:hypothetical protein
VLAMFLSGDTSKNIKNGEIAEDDPEKMELLGCIYGNALLNILPELKIDSAYYSFAGERTIFQERSEKQFRRFKEVEKEIDESTRVILDKLEKEQKEDTVNHQNRIRRDMVLTDPVFDIANIQFAVHYFFENPQKLEGLLKNVDENLVNGGYFIGTCFDGQRVMEYLKDTPEGKDRTYTVGDYKAIAIRKEYTITEEDFEWTPDTEESAAKTTANEPAMLGKQISVFQETFGEYYPEYLVNFEYFKWKCAQYNLYPLESVHTLSDILDKDEYNKMLTLSMSNFSEFYKDYVFKNGTEMDEELQELSFLNRIFIFKKVDDTPRQEYNITEELSDITAVAIAGVEGVEDTVKREGDVYKWIGDPSVKGIDKALAEYANENKD